MDWRKGFPASQLLICLLMADPAVAGSHCVSDDASLQLALSAAASNGEADLVKIQTGSYSGGLIYSTDEVFELSVVGGYDSQCSTKTNDSALTALDGGGIEPVLVVSSSNTATVNIENISVSNGYRDEYYGGGLYINLQGGEVYLTSVAFVDNVIGTGAGGGVAVYGADVEVVNCTFTGNSANSGSLSSGAFIYGRGGALFASGAKVYGSHFESNSANSAGAAISSGSLVESSSFVNNSGPSIVSSSQVLNSAFKGNDGIAISAGASYSDQILVRGNLISGNTSSSSRWCQKFCV